MKPPRPARVYRLEGTFGLRVTKFDEVFAVGPLVAVVRYGQELLRGPNAPANLFVVYGVGPGPKLTWEVDLEATRVMYGTEGRR